VKGTLVENVKPDAKTMIFTGRYLKRMTLFRMAYRIHMAHVAQLVEHVLGKDEVTRSIRVVGSIPTLGRAAVVG
jgi:hypothetical protein